VAGKTKLCDPSLTRAILSALEGSSHEKVLNKCPVFNLFNFNFKNHRNQFRRFATIRRHHRHTYT